MAVKINNLRDINEQIIKKLTFKQKAIIIGTFAISVIAIISVILLSNKAQYTVLFNNLDPADANKIVEKINERSIKYELSDNGRTISVPQEKVYELRLQLAGEGLPMNSVVGYEIFDKTNFGISDFQQKVNFRRALEGELVRTIMKLEAVEGAQVRIVLPDKALFKEDQKKTTASVVLKLKSNKGLTTENITAISNLVASSVEGLDPQGVTIIDSKGHLLSNPESPDKLASLTASQHDMKKKVEAYLSDKAQSMLDQVLGPGKSVVRVNAELNYNQVEKTSKTYDPNKVIRSEKTLNQAGINYDTASEFTNGNRLTNYEVGETVEHIINEVGSLKKLSIAAMVDGTYKDSEVEGKVIREYNPRTQEEMKKIADAIKSSIGYDETRADFVSIENVIFDTNVETELGIKKKFELDLTEIIRLALILLAMIGSVVILISLLKVLKPKEEAISAKEEKIGRELPELEKIVVEKPMIKPKEVKPPPIIEIPEPEQTEEELKQIEIRKRVSEYIVDKPTEAINLVKLWLLEDEGGR
jgi:flagellar M-ring protein FliF